MREVTREEFDNLAQRLAFLEEREQARTNDEEAVAAFFRSQREKVD